MSAKLSSLIPSVELHSYTRVTSPSAHDAGFPLDPHRKANPASHAGLRKGFFHHGRVLLWMNDSWTPEALSCALATCSLVGLIATLGVFQDHVVSELPFQVSMNAIVAIFAAIIKAALLMPVAEGIGELKWVWYSVNRRLLDFDTFDRASRGPWGSILLIAKLRGRHLAALGSWITIAAIAIDPFSQQLVRYYSCSRVATEVSARIPRTNNYTGAGTHTGGGMANLNAAMQAAIYVGLLDPPEDPSSAVPVQCLTGNCTFPADNITGATHQTLAMCSSCRDLTSSVRSNSSSLFWLPGFNETDMKVAVPIRLITTVYSGFNYNYTKLDEPSWLSFTTLITNTDWTHENKTTSAFAAQCRLYSCIKTLRSNVTNTILYETEIESLPIQENEFSNFHWPTLHISNTTIRNGSREDCTPSQEFSAQHPVPVNNGTLVWEANETTVWYPNDCIWTIDYDTNLAMFAELMSFFHDKRLETYYGQPDARYSAGPVWLTRLYNNGTANLASVTAYVDALAGVMTANMRQWGMKGQTAYAEGFAHTAKTCIRIEWGWLAFPVVMVLATGGFLLLTSLRSARQAAGRRGPWKSGVLATVFNGVEHDCRVKFGGVDKNSEMLGVAEDVSVRLEHTDVGWRLKDRARVHVTVDDHDGR